MSDVNSTAVTSSEEPVVRTAPLGGGALSRALQQGTTAARWMEKHPATAAEWNEQFRIVRNSHAGHDWLTPLAPAFAATGEARSRLNRAAESGVVVTTGQQPGLFGGPMYTWSKAIAALALADELEQQLGFPVAPVFWAATDDADWLEAAVTHVVGANGLETLTLEGPATEGIAMAEVPLGETETLIARLRAASGSAAHPDILDLVESAYVAHATIGASYVQLLRGVLEPLGIAVLDASHPALRNAADPLLRRALSSATAVDDGVRANVAHIRAAGFEPQVEDVNGLTLVFRTTRTERGNTRERVPVANAARVAREAEIGTLGPNVLLRPVVERALLPTMAYVAGPGEFAYFAQVAPVARALQVDVPIAVPRWSGTVVEPHIAIVLDRLQVDERAFDDPHAVETKLAKGALDEGITDALERVRVTTETQLRALQLAVESSDWVVAQSVIEGTQRDISHKLDRLERRIIAGVKRRERALMRDVAVARAAIRPLNQNSERVLNFLPVLARYGPVVLENMRQLARVHAANLVNGLNSSP
ncbi:MAG: bacillithiol biosynthesis BshC [Gemmatimonadaceae bacterium]